MLLHTILFFDFNHLMSEIILSIDVACPTTCAVMHTLLYFEFFAHPLSANEVWMYGNSKQGAAGIEDKLNELVAQGIIYQFNGYYQTKNEPRWLVQRQEAEARAQTYLPIALRMSKLMACFPFVRAVFVSGSLSKGIVKSDGDIDYFLITAPGRLWLARTLLILFKKTLLFNSHKYFCVNYFIDTTHLEIEEKNLFTATETVTLLPLYDQTWYEQFCNANPWAWQYYPNFLPRPKAYPAEKQRFYIKNLLEWLLSGRLGTWLDKRCMQLTLKFWQRKFQAMDTTIFEVALKSRRYVSKHHPLNFQQRVLDQFKKRWEEEIK